MGAGSLRCLPTSALHDEVVTYFMDQSRDWRGCQLKDHITNMARRHTEMWERCGDATSYNRIYTINGIYGKT